MLKKIIVAALVVTSAVFAQTNIGARAAFNFGNIWGDNTEDAQWGAGFNAGVAAKIDLTPMIAFVPGIEVDLRRITEDAPLFDEVSYSFWFIDMPFLARFNITPQLFADAGLNLGFNLKASQTIKLGGDSETNDVDNAKSVDVGLVVGAGFTMIPNFDINFRFLLGFTDMVDMENVGSKNLRFQAGVTYWFM